MWFVFWVWDDGSGPSARVSGPWNSEQYHWDVYTLRNGPNVKQVILTNTETGEVWLCKQDGNPCDIEITPKEG